MALHQILLQDEGAMMYASPVSLFWPTRNFIPQRPTSAILLLENRDVYSSFGTNENPFSQVFSTGQTRYSYPLIYAAGGIVPLYQTSAYPNTYISPRREHQQSANYGYHPTHDHYIHQEAVHHPMCNRRIFEYNHTPLNAAGVQNNPIGFNRGEMAYMEPDMHHFFCNENDAFYLYNNATNEPSYNPMSAYYGSRGDNTAENNQNGIPEPDNIDESVVDQLDDNSRSSTESPQLMNNADNPQMSSMEQMPREENSDVSESHTDEESSSDTSESSIVISVPHIDDQPPHGNLKAVPKKKVPGIKKKKVKILWDKKQFQKRKLRAAARRGVAFKKEKKNIFFKK